MPRKPLRPCYYPGCPKVTDHPRGYCPQHLPEKYRQENAQRGTSTERGYNYRWRKYRAQYLTENPLCVNCLALRPEHITPATEVDHIIPHRGNYHLFWDSHNHQALCKPCHSTKTAAEDGAFGNQMSSDTDSAIKA